MRKRVVGEANKKESELTKAQDGMFVEHDSAKRGCPQFACTQFDGVSEGKRKGRKLAKQGEKRERK